jgi:hypothetical protein
MKRLPLGCSKPGNLQEASVLSFDLVAYSVTRSNVPPGLAIELSQGVPF